MSWPWPYLLLAAVPGLVLGSYAVTAGVRMGRRQGSTLGGSHCDACGCALRYRHTVPVLSYIGLRGACAACGARIDPIHPIGELAGALVVVGALWAAEPARAVLLSILGLALIAASAVDAKTLRLPDVLTATVAVAGLALSTAEGTEQLLAGGVAAVAATLVLVGLRAARRGGGDPGLGLGDVKLIAALALWLGAATPLAVLGASALGLAAAPWARDSAGRLPFGPMIALGGWAVGLLTERGWSPWGL